MTPYLHIGSRLLGSLAALCIVLLPCLGKAHDNPPDITRIQQSGQLVVAMTEFDSLPFYGKCADQLQGIDIDIAQAVANLLEVRLVVRRDAKSFADVVEQVRDHKVDMAASKLSITGPRMAMVRFSHPYMQLKQALIVNRLWLSQHGEGRDAADVIRQFDGSIAFIANSSYSTFAKKYFPHAQPQPNTSWDHIVQGVMAGTIAAGYRDEFEIKRIAWDYPQASITTKTVTLTDSVDNLAVAVPHTDTALLAVVDFVIDNNFTGIDVRKLIHRYQSLTRGTP
jgi:polar amino acid transport system substrate-binding protein